MCGVGLLYLHFDSACGESPIRADHVGFRLLHDDFRLGLFVEQRRLLHHPNEGHRRRRGIAVSRIGRIAEREAQLAHASAVLYCYERPEGVSGGAIIPHLSARHFRIW
jgi:hypothetical protein